MNVGSLFSGIGGFDYGLERAGMRVVWQCEADEFCRRVLTRHWPGVPCYPDVRELTGATVAPVDVLCGGFPCQDISLAGRGAGIDGARSGLWGEYARLVGELRPRYVVVENVAALLTRGLGRVVGDLAALGYDAEWDCLPASAFGAPHRRDRLWLIAYPQRNELRNEPAGLTGSGGQAVVGDDGETRSLADAERERELQPSGTVGEVGRWPAHGGEPRDMAYPDQWRGAGRQEPARGGRDVAHAEGESVRAGLRESEPGGERRGRSSDGGSSGELQDADECTVQPWRIGGRAAQAGGSEWWAVEPPVGRVAHGVPDRLGQLAALGNALVPQIAEWLGTQIIDYERTTA